MPTRAKIRTPNQAKAALRARARQREQQRQQEVFYTNHDEITMLLRHIANSLNHLLEAHIPNSYAIRTAHLNAIPKTREGYVKTYSAQADRNDLGRHVSLRSR